MPLRVGLPPAGVDEREAPVEVVALVRHAVASHTGRVFDDGFAAAEDAIDQRRLADVRASDDGDHRQGRQVADALFALFRELEHLEVVFVERVVGEPRAQGDCPLFGKVVVDVGKPFGEIVGDDLLVVVLVALVGHFVSSSRQAASSRRKPRSIQPVTG